LKHLNPLNSKARRLTEALEAPGLETGGSQTGGSEPREVVALTPRVPQQPQGPHIPLGCSTVFAPGWEVDRTGGTAGLCQPVERDLFDCHLGCFWPAQVPDQLNHAPDWTKKCAAAQKDWRKIDVIFP
jgi:hypothetical protein